MDRDFLSVTPSLSKGFTLLELLVVMTLATLVLALVPASFSSMAPYVERQTEVRQFVLDLRAARGAAIRASNEVSLKLDMANHRYYLEGEENIKQLPADLNIYYQPPFTQELAQTVISINFYADGSSTGGVIEMRTEEDTYRITIDWLTGRVHYHEQS